MKKLLVVFLLFIVVLVSIPAILNIDVTTKQGIDYQWHTTKIPLYLKVLDFMDRHYNYQQLVERIIDDEDNEQERIVRIFEWTHKNIRKAPKGFPIIDDHVWHIIVRGYGVSDQSSDVFTTLCNYAEIDAFFDLVHAKDHSSKLILSFVKLNNEWIPFDPYHGVYFMNNEGDFASIEEINKGRYSVECLGSADAHYPDYAKYLVDLPYIDKVRLNRSNTQSPLNRLLFAIKQWFKLKT